MMIKNLENLFSHAANPTIALKQSAYMRNLFPFLGITKPERAVLEKQAFKQFNLKEQAELKQILMTLWQKEEREFHYSALTFAQKHRKLWTPHILPTFEAMIRSRSWWDTVDTIAPNLVGHLVKSHPELLKTMDLWIDDPHLWIRRAALLFQLRWKKATDETRLFDYCQKRMHEKDFFIRKAIGWVLREYSKTSPEVVRKFLDLNIGQLSRLSFSEARKYL